MKIIRNLLDQKGYSLHTTTPDLPIRDALRMMIEKRVGSLLVFEGAEIRGIVTERDFVRWAAHGNETDSGAPVEAVMDPPKHRVALDSSVDAAMRLMTEKRVRHLIVEEQGRIVGLVSIGDVVVAMLTEQATEIEQLQRYIQGEAPPSP